MISYYKDGSNGVSLTKEKYFFEDGSIRNEVNYNASEELHGKWISYYNNGKKEYERQYYNGVVKNEKRYNKDGSIIKVFTPILGLWDVHEFAWYVHNTDTGKDSLSHFASAEEIDSWGNVESYEYNKEGKQIYTSTMLDKPIVSLYHVRNDEIIFDDNICKSLDEPYKAKFSISGDTLRLNMNWFECPDWDFPENMVIVTLIRKDEE